MSILSLSIDEIPSLFSLNSSGNSFVLKTIWYNGTYVYKIIRELDEEIYYMNFSIDMTSYNGNGLITYLILEIPYNPSNFSTEYDSAIIPLNLNYNSGNFSISGISQAFQVGPGTYKFLATHRDTNKEVPAQIYLNETYNYAGADVRFIYFRKVNNDVFYTGYFGNKFINEGDNIPNIGQNIFDGYFLELSGIYYIFLEVTSTPGIIKVGEESIVVTLSLPPPVFYYNAIGEKFELRILKHCLFNYRFVCYLRVQNLNGDYISGRVFSVSGEFNIISQETVTVGGINYYFFNINYNGTNQNPDFELI